MTAAQALAEFVCRRRAEREGVTLAARFWVLPRWRRLFTSQVVMAHRLLGQYPAGVIFRVLRSAGGLSCHSLGAPFLREMLCKASAQALQPTASPARLSAVPPCPRGVVGFSILDKLRQLDE